MNATRAVLSRRHRASRRVRRTHACACVVVAVVLAVAAGRTAAQEVLPSVPATTQAAVSSDVLPLTSVTPTPAIDGYGGNDIDLEIAMEEWLRSEQERRERNGDDQTNAAPPNVLGDRTNSFFAENNVYTAANKNVSAYANTPPFNKNDFVRVSGTRFLTGCPPSEYKIVGWNTYTLIEQAAEIPVGSFSADFSKRGKQQVLEMLDAAAASGFNTVRTWGFNVGESQAFQLRPGVYHEPSFRGLDWVLHQARKRNVRLILVLADYWEVSLSKSPHSAD
jgi:hypothetical protein